MALEGFPSRPGTQLVKASAKFKVPKPPPVKKRRPGQQLGVPPVATGKTVTGAATSTTRIGY